MIQQNIREHIAKFIPTSVFNYGRPADTALASAEISIDDWFIHLDPVTFEGTVDDKETARIVIGFLKQDSPDSSFDNENELSINDSIELLQHNAKLKALSWLNDFLDNYRYGAVTYTLTPATRIKNVMSGVLLTVNLNYKQRC